MNAVLERITLDSDRDRQARAQLAGWQAELVLGFEYRGTRSVLTERRHRGPLLVQRPLYPEGDAVCHTILLHPPAGIAGGDSLAVTARIGRHAHALITTPGAGKWYRGAGQQGRMRQHIQVDAGGCCEWLPQESIVYDGALGRLDTEIHLHGDAVFIGAEMACLGRTGAGERFTQGSFTPHTRLWRDGRPLWLERGHLSGSDALLASPVGLAGQPVFATLIAAAPDIAPTLYSACREQATHCTDGQTGEGAASLLPGGLLVARWRGPSSEAGRRWLTGLWSLLRPALCGRPAVLPRIWHT